MRSDEVPCTHETDGQQCTHPAIAVCTVCGGGLFCEEHVDEPCPVCRIQPPASEPAERRASR